MIGILALLAGAAAAGFWIFIYFGKYWYDLLTLERDDRD